MTPEQMSERLAAWVAEADEPCVCTVACVHTVTRRVVCVEPEGPRRTWVLTEGGRQVGHARVRLGTMRATPVGAAYSVGLTWTVEASDRTREMLGLDD